VIKKKERKEIMIKKILGVLTILILLGGLFWILDKGLKKQEKAECLKWLKWSKEYPNFYWTRWQVKQCKSLKILK